MSNQHNIDVGGFELMVMLTVGISECYATYACVSVTGDVWTRVCGRFVILYWIAYQFLDGIIPFGQHRHGRDDWITILV